MPDIIRLPKVFFDDHASRELPTPVVVRENARYVYVKQDDPALPELLSDARYYADGVDQCDRGLVMSARATVRALNGEAA